MSKGYVDKILDPAKALNLLQHMPLMTGDLGKSVHRLEGSRYTKDLLSAKAKNYAGAAGPATLNYEHVAAADRVSYFDLDVDPTPSPHLELHLEEAQVSTTIIRGKGGKVLRPIFYLPYRQSGTTRMKLASPPGGGDEVRFFATATIDGCSVYIEGDPAAPKVSHLNAAHVAVMPQRGETEANKLLRVQQKSADMDARLNVIKKGPAGVVERKDYIADTALGQTQMRQMFADRNHLPHANVFEYQPFGAVVGLKSGASWTFYLQKCGRFAYRKKPGGPSFSAFMVIEARECWPAGGGVFRTL